MNITDVDNEHFQRFPDAEKQKYIDMGDVRLNEFAKEKGVNPDDIDLPITGLLLEYMQAYVLTRFAKARIGAGVNDMGQSVYNDIYAVYRDELRRLGPQITAYHFTGQTNEHTGTTARRTINMIRRS